MVDRTSPKPDKLGFAEFFDRNLIQVYGLGAPASAS